MRLKCIKLAGFKSFVDPTTVQFPSNLCAIVGPNGCGKSNIIDAVRWVMGESSAKNLRGESMADVIFNGSSARKPIGQASIELVFDNTETRLTGDLAAYSEISIRRKVVREGTSQYYLNGTKCRRRDITDIFLGTGLGPRSYAIIEQGMISRLIDAKPEELRVYIEEAAGISKYKERRRETENRIRSTRENLERLEDIREELDKQLRTLKRQSEAAAKFKEYKKEERELKAQALAMQWQALDSELAQQKETINEGEIRMEAGVAQQRAVFANIESNRSQLSDANEAFNEVQSRYYAIGAEIARAEQSIQHQKDRLSQLNQDLQQATLSSEEIQSHLQADQHKLDINIAELAVLQPQMVQLARDEEVSREALNEVEQRMHAWQASWDDFNQSASGASQAAEVQQSKIELVESTHGNLLQRISRLEEEQSTLAGHAEDSDLALMDAELGEAELSAQQLKSDNEDLAAAIRQRRESQREMGQQLNQQRTSLQSMRGKFASLEALQQAALGQSGNATGRWLEEQNLSSSRRLAESLKVDSGWDKAAETVLGNYLQAVEVESIERYSQGLDSIDSGQLVLLDSSTGSAAPSSPDFLRSKIQGNDSVLDQLLAGVRVGSSLEDALRQRASLSVGESIITPEGIWIGRNWLRLARDEDAQAGVLKRQEEMSELDVMLEEAERSEQELEGALNDLSAELSEQEQQLAEQQARVAEMARAQGELRAKISAKRVRMEEAALRHQRTVQELSENREQFDDQSLQLAEARELLQIALEEMAANDEQRSALIESRDSLRVELDQARSEARSRKDLHHEQAMRSQSMQSEVNSLQQSVARMALQAEQLSSRQLSLNDALAESSRPIKENTEELESKLAERLVVEEEQNKARYALEDIESKMRELDTARGDAEQAVLAIRADVENMRLQNQTLQVRQEGVVEQLAEGKHDLDAVIAGLPEDATLPLWQEQIERMANRIQRLGAINLAAIDEYEQQSERKTYLDAQNDELQSALETLEDAIRKIDKETRSRFKETFDIVNDGLSELFPKVFGGGHAYLEMTGDDLLDTGIAIMARPPGKRNSTIHLLSGGEKALTAIALVFSIFQLRPAPFCMLDEVDAPLDDANVGRYARMVEEMSKTIQFIYISHNKIAMEMAKQLMGVTMHEAGVSRLVSVDVDEAVELAAV